MEYFYSLMINNTAIGFYGPRVKVLFSAGPVRMPRGVEQVDYGLLLDAPMGEDLDADILFYNS